ncbi:protein kinase domain-containing protein [Rhodopirellula europaea]|uniref:protein kinase domain-containing protein n=1 Tax=Rhodopirellula europaea TaxID=1263866 RepID=UPI003D266F5C
MNETTTIVVDGSETCVTTRDEAILNILETYLSARNVGPVNKSQFIAEQTESLSRFDLSAELPGLLASVDAAHGFPATEPWHAESTSNQDCVWGNLVSKTLGDFEILDEIGRGGMGVVYRARQVSLSRIVALKVLPLSVVLDRQQVARFSVEAQAAGQLNHSHIVPIYWVGREEGVHCYSMPLIEGNSLEQIMEDQNSTELDIANAIRWMNEASLALNHSHQNGVIHRDIKPSNLLIDESNKLWVTDFGLARLGGQESLTRSGVVVGTFRYMSPEQASGNPVAVDHRSDIYGLGVTFYELLTGAKLFDPLLIRETTSRFTSTVIQPRRLNPRISRDLETILLKTLAVDPNERYDSAKALSDDLVRCLEGRPIQARRPSLYDRSIKWVMRHSRAVTIAVAAGLVLLVSSIAATARFASQGRQLRAALQLADERLATSESNRRIAEENFKETQQVLDHFGLMAAERLRGVAGAETLREQLVEDLLRHYERRVGRMEGKPNAGNEMAQTHVRAARIIEEVGAIQRALETYQRALVLYEKQESDEATTVQRAVCRSSIALLLAETGQTDEATRQYKRSIEELTSVPSRDRVETVSLARIHANFGLLLGSLDRIEEANIQFTAAVEQLPPIGERNTAELQTAAMILNNLSDQHRQTDLAASLQYNQRAIETLRSSPKINSDSELARSLALSLNNQASLLVRQGDGDQTRVLFDEAIEIYRRLLQRNPMVARYTEELAITYNNYGRCLHGTGDMIAAKNAFSRASDLLTVLTQRMPDESRYKDALTGVAQNLVRTEKAAKARLTRMEVKP